MVRERAAAQMRCGAGHGVWRPAPRLSMYGPKIVRTQEAIQVVLQGMSWGVRRRGCLTSACRGETARIQPG